VELLTSNYNLYFSVVELVALSLLSFMRFFFTVFAVLLMASSTGFLPFNRYDDDDDDNNV